MELPYKDTKSIHNALFIEHNVQRIITQQEKDGVQFDSRKARFYIYILRERQAQLYQKIRPHLSLQLSLPFAGPVSKPYLKSGGYTSSVHKWYGAEEIDNVKGPFSRVEFVEPNLGKRAKLITQLLHMGWRPDNFTEKGNPKLTVDGAPCPSLLRIANTIGKDIADWYISKHRDSQITGWLTQVRPDGRLTAGAITIGTPTFRFRHNTVVNVPKASPKVFFGRQMRSLFTVRKSNRLVGHDASGLELRMLADVINDEEFTQEVVNGDPHTKNQNDAGLPTRDDAKTFIYAFIYGAGDGKIGSIVGGSRVVGKRIKTRFLQNNPRLAEAITSTQRAASRGYLIGIDGRRIIMRRDKFTGEIQTHKALNTRLQSAGAIVMKWSMVLLDEWIRQYNLDAMKVIDMHDEGQHEVALKDIRMMELLAPLSIVKAGELLQLNVPLAADVKVGTNWAQTH